MPPAKHSHEQSHKAQHAEPPAAAAPSPNSVEIAMDENGSGTATLKGTDPLSIEHVVCDAPNGVVGVEPTEGGTSTLVRAAGGMPGGKVTVSWRSVS